MCGDVLLSAGAPWVPVRCCASLTFSAVTVGRLRGISGTATYAGKPYRPVVVALPDQSARHLFVLATVIHARATARDIRQYKAVVASLRPMR
jgi:hypothetical protein